MGLFDFLKRKQPELQNDDGPSPEYLFAHYALRQIALSDPLRFLAIVASPDAQKFVDAILEDVAEQSGRKATFDAKAISIHTTRVNSFPCAVIELPEPNEMAEAHMVALVVNVDPTTEPADLESVSARYFTLEKGFSLSNEPRTVFAEWDLEGHSNFGDGPDPVVDEFVKAMEGLLNRYESDEAAS